MPIEEGHTLGAAVCSNKPNCFYYVTFENDCAGDCVTPRKACIIHANLDGSVILKKEIDTSKKGLDLYKWEMGAVLTCDGKGCV
jgi:hypothetical protein